MSPNSLLLSFARKNNFSISENKFTRTLINHPFYPSLLSITDCLNAFGIQAEAVIITNDQDPFPLLPFIALQNNADAPLLLIDKNASLGTLKSNKEWNRIVIYSKNRGSKELDSNQPLLRFSPRHTKYLWLLSLIFLFFLVALLGSTSLGLHAAFMTIGLILSINKKLLDLNTTRQLLPSFCQSRICSTQTESNQVGYFDKYLASTSIIYFTFGLFIPLIAFSSTDNTKSTILIYLALALPGCAYSMYAQLIRNKQLCFHCFLISLCIILPFLIALLNSPPITVSSIKSVIPIVVTLSILLSLLPKTESLISELNEEYLTGKQSIRYLNNYDSLKSILNDQNKIKIDILPEEIIFGPNNATDFIVVIYNPLCKPCADAHKEITKIIKSNKTKVIVRFCANLKSLPQTDQENLKIFYRKFSSFRTDIKSAIDFLDYWFTNYDLSYKATASSTSNESTSDQLLEKICAWADEYNIISTPTLIVNSRLFPRNIPLSSLTYAITISNPNNI